MKKALIYLLSAAVIVSAIPFAAIAESYPYAADIYEYTDNFSGVEASDILDADNPIVIDVVKDDFSTYGSDGADKDNTITMDSYYVGEPSEDGVLNTDNIKNKDWNYITTRSSDFLAWKSYVYINDADNRVNYGKRSLVYFKQDDPIFGNALHMKDGSDVLTFAVPEYYDFQTNTLAGFASGKTIRRLSYTMAIYDHARSGVILFPTNFNSAGTGPSVKANYALGVTRLGYNITGGATAYKLDGTSRVTEEVRATKIHPSFSIGGTSSVKYYCEDLVYDLDTDIIKWDIIFEGDTISWSAEIINASTNVSEGVWKCSYTDANIEALIDQKGADAFAFFRGTGYDKTSPEYNHTTGTSVTDVKAEFYVEGEQPSCVDNGDGTLSFLVKPSSLGAKGDINIICANYSLDGTLIETKLNKVSASEDGIVSTVFNLPADGGETKIFLIGGSAYTLLGESENVLYYNSIEKSTDDVYSLSGSVHVRRIFAPEFAGQTKTVYLSQDNTEYDAFEAEFDMEGYWLNTVTDKCYSFVKLESEQGITVYSDAVENTVIKLPMGGSVSLAERIGGNMLDEATVWETSDSDCVNVANGIVSAGKRGTATVRATSNDVTLTVDIRVLDELEYAQLIGNEEEFVNSKKPLFNLLNTAIKNNDKTSLDTILTGAGNGTFETMPCVDVEDVKALKNTDLAAFNSYLDRIITYGEFECGGVDDIRLLEEALNAELITGKLNNVSDTAVMEGLLKDNKDVFEINLDEPYYLEAKQNVLERMLNRTYANVYDVSASFEESYVMSNFADSDSYTYIGELVEDLTDEIGYDKTYYESLSNDEKTQLYKALKEDQSSIDTLKKLKEYINDFEPEEKIVYNTPSRGGSGGGGSSKASISMPAVTVEKPTVQEGTISPAVQIYDDVTTTHWAYEPIRYLTAKKAASGDGDGYFYPDRNVTRAEFIKMLLSAFDVAVVKPKTAEGEEIQMPFADVELNAWYCDYMFTAKDIGVLKGDGKNAYPDRQISREEVSALVYRMLEIKEIELVYSVESKAFKDAAEISEWAFPAVAKLQISGVIDGTSDGRFAPKMGATRAETAKIIYKACTAEKKVIITEEESANE